MSACSSRSETKSASGRLQATATPTVVLMLVQGLQKLLLAMSPCKPYDDCQGSFLQTAGMKPTRHRPVTGVMSRALPSRSAKVMALSVKACSKDACLH